MPKKRQDHYRNSSSTLAHNGTTVLHGAATMETSETSACRNGFTFPSRSERQDFSSVLHGTA